MTDDDRFEQAWRRWAMRAPRRSPEMAARAVRAALPPRRRPKARWVAALATGVAAVLAAVVLTLRPSAPPRQPTQVGVVVEAPRLGSGEVLLWLDDGTPLYMTFASDGTNVPGGGS